MMKLNPFNAQRLELENWQNFKVFEALTEQLIDAASDDFITHGELKWLREAKTACMFGKVAQATRARLIADDKQKADCEIVFGRGSHLRFQIAEVVERNRRRTKDYRRWIEVGRPPIFHQGDPSANWVSIIPALRQVILDKVVISYPAGTSLLLYFNIATYGCWDEQVESAFIECTEIGRSKFASIWVLWGQRLLRCWPEPFKPSDTDLRPGRHELGRALRSYENSRLLNGLFASDRVRI